MPPRTFRTSFILIALALGLTLTACGRRGPLEPPPTPEQIKAEQDREKQRQERRAKRQAQDVAEQGGQTTPAGDESSVKAGPGQVVVREQDGETPDQFNPQLMGRPQRSNRAYVIPKRDFILDPLL
jgi:predicted small lipoprotein YifL